VRGDGRIYRPRTRGKESPKFWIQFSANGRVYREVGGRTHREAKTKLRARIREIQGDRFVGLEQERLTVAEVLDSRLRDLVARRAKSPETAISRMKPVKESTRFFSGRGSSGGSFREVPTGTA
jgi:hypothetical protein